MDFIELQDVWAFSVSGRSLNIFCHPKLTFGALHTVSKADQEQVTRKYSFRSFLWAEPLIDLPYRIDGQYCKSLWARMKTQFTYIVSVLMCERCNTQRHTIVTSFCLPFFYSVHLSICNQNIAALNCIINEWRQMKILRRSSLLTRQVKPVSYILISQSCESYTYILLKLQVLYKENRM